MSLSSQPRPPVVTGLLDLKGSTDASANPNYPVALKGDAYVISVAGKVGGGSGKTVAVGDFLIAIANNAGGTEASVGTSWVVLEANLLLGANVATALAIAIGSAGAVVVLNGALGTPSSGTLSNCAGLKVAVKSTAAGYTVGTTDPNELYGGVIYVTGAATIVVPAVAAGASFTIVTIGAVAVSVDPNASDLIVRDGTAQADGEKITNLSTAGDIAVFTYYDGTGWHASTNGWTNGG